MLRTVGVDVGVDVGKLHECDTQILCYNWDHVIFNFFEGSQIFSRVRPTIKPSVWQQYFNCLQKQYLNCKNTSPIKESL